MVSHGSQGRAVPVDVNLTSFPPDDVRPSFAGCNYGFASSSNASCHRTPHVHPMPYITARDSSAACTVASNPVDRYCPRTIVNTNPIKAQRHPNRRAMSHSIRQAGYPFWLLEQRTSLDTPPLILYRRDTAVMLNQITLFLLDLPTGPTWSKIGDERRNDSSLSAFAMIQCRRV